MIPVRLSTWRKICYMNCFMAMEGAAPFCPKTLSRSYVIHHISRIHFTISFKRKVDRFLYTAIVNVRLFPESLY